MSRRLYIDWLRGLAVLIMILWHAVDAWTIQTGRDTTAFSVVAFAAGWVAPLFLFLAGVSIPLAAAARMSRGDDRAGTSWALQKRGWQVFLIAHLFRFQSFLLNPNDVWDSLLKPDILNILGLGIVATAYCWGRATPSRADLIRWLLIPAAAIVMLTPLSLRWWWPTLLHPRIEAYIRPVANYGQFSLFPAVAYMFAGIYVGALVAASDARDSAAHAPMAKAGAALVAVGVAANLMPWLGMRYWTDPAAVFLWRTGAMTLAVALSAVLFRRRSPSRWNPLLVFGQTSLFVYWVHVELAYGIFSYPLHHALVLPWSLLAYAVLTAFMFGCAVLWLRRSRGPLIPAHMSIAK